MLIIVITVLCLVEICAVIAMCFQPEEIAPCETVDLDDHREDVAFNTSNSRRKLSGLQRKLGKHFA